MSSVPPTTGFPSGGFTGFPPEGLKFLQDLQHSNRREWFTSHKELYTSCVKHPARALVADLGERVAAEFPPAASDLRGNGGSLMRINRDVRFSQDKSPYKTSVAIMFTLPGMKKMATPGFGIQITVERVEFVVGQFSFWPEELTRYRAAVADERRGVLLEQAVAEVEQAAAAAAASEGSAVDVSLGGQELKRVPRAYAPDHPRARWLRHKGLVVFPGTLPHSRALGPELIDAALQRFRIGAPVWRWLVDHVTFAH